MAIPSIDVMDPQLLQQFRQQLATWIEQRLASHRLPFQRLEIGPGLLTPFGPATPDLVLWINPESYLAGSMILLPLEVDEAFLKQATGAAAALGLFHFATWEARQVCLWQTDNGEAVCSKRYPLPDRESILAEDFQRILDLLIDDLKVVSVTTTPTRQQLRPHYYANLCLRTLQELNAGLTDSARLAAGATAEDEWLADAPWSKGWMSLWRILLLLSRDLVPPGLQPERLEQALHYALADCIAEDQRLKGLAIRDDEPPLLDSEAIRLHHLASRMRQLGWPQSRDHCQDLIELLLEEVADRYGIESLEIIRRRAGNALWMNCLPPSPKDVGLLVAPRPILAGRVLLSTLSTTDDPMAYAEHWQSLQAGPDFAEVSAVLQTAGPIRRTEREARLVLLRQVWPNRRFEVPKEAPSWLWDALYLAGTPSEVLNLLLPEGWHRAAGLSGLWDALRERYQLTGLRIDQHSRQLLQWSANVAETASLTLDRQADGHQISLPWPDCKPATIQLLARASRAALNYLQKADMAPRDDTFGVWTPALTWGTYIFLQTRFGQYLWALCDCGASTPELDRIPRLVIDQGVPLPNETCLLDLSSTWSPESWPPHDAQALEEEFTNILGTAPNVRTSVEDQTDTAKRKQPRKRRPIEEIVQGVFVDGRPDFPAQYLMAFYRPETVTYAIDGPLEITATFFDRITLQNGQTNRTLDVNGRLAAEALVLASHAGARQVKLPQDEAILASIVEKYRQELRSLWDQLIRECRRNEPHRQAALRLARRIWQQMGLPPERYW
ncbi:MAG: hypothetical protein P8Y84_11645 [Desulfuromonadales bacterium]